MTPAGSDSSSTSAALEVDTLTAPLIDGRTYKITWHGGYSGDTVGDGCMVVVLEGSGGTALSINRFFVTSTAALEMAYVSFEYTAAADGDQDFVVQISRSPGTGDVYLRGGTAYERYFYCDYISG
jgi:hypothetical protein